MSIEVKIPSVGESITSGLISAWHKAEGDQVAAGDLLLTLETDKVSSEIAAEDAGVLHLQAREGEEVKVGQVVATIDDSGAASPPPVSEPKEKTEAPAPQADQKPAEKAEAKPAPIAEPEPPRPSQSPAPGRDPSGRTTRQKMSPLRRKIATQLVMAQQTAAILTTFNEADMGEVMALRGKLQEDFIQRHDIKLGFMSFFVKAAVAALKAVPSVNGRLEGEEFVQNHYYDIGVAVGTEKGLIVPVIRDAGQKSFAEIEQDIAAYAKKAREGKIVLEDLRGGVFTISNGGIYGSLLSTPILNPPQSGILGLHKIQERPMAVNGQVVIRPMMYLALSYDHRVIDGKEAVTFLVRMKESIESPARLMLDL